MTNIFIKTKLDKPEELEEDRKPFGGILSVETVKTKNVGCFSCCLKSKSTSSQDKERECIADRMERRRTMWMSFTGDRETIDIERKILSSRLVLKSPGYLALTSTKNQYRIPIFLSDVQRFLLLPLLNPQRYDYFTTKWIDIVRRDEVLKSVLLVVDGATFLHYKNYKSIFLNLTNAFHSSFEVITNTVNDGSVIEVLSLVPLIAADHENIVKTYGCIESAMHAIDDPTTMLRTIFPIALDSKLAAARTPDIFSRQRLVLDASQMIDEGFPIPVPGKLKDKCTEYMMTKEKYLPVSSSSPLFALACERCDQNDVTSGLYRITLIDEKYDVLYDSYVLPYNKIFSHKNASELTMQMLLDMKTRIEEAHKQIKQSITPDSILVGDSLQDDLHSLKLMHPYVINTNSIFNFTGSRRWRSKLRDIAMHYLSRDIEGNKERSSTEYALASMELVHLKLAHNVQFGDKVLTRQQDKHILIGNTARKLAQKSSIIIPVDKEQETPVILGSETVIKKYTELITKKHSGKTEDNRQIMTVPCSTNKNVVTNTRKIIKDHCLTVAHVNFVGKDVMNSETSYRLDKWVRFLWNSCPSDTLMSVLFTGDKDNSGALFVNIKD